MKQEGLTSRKQELLGRYFPYCQFCEHDGRCVLLHHEFMGMSSAGEVDKTRYPGHEDLRWHLSFLQRGTTRAMCAGRIRATDSIYFPLGCACGTVMDDGFCQKFTPNERGKERQALAERIANERGIPLSEVQPADLPPLDQSYTSAMDSYYPDLPRT